MPINDLKKTPLYEEHLKLNAKMVPFAGWLMPLQYTGIIDEHMHAREKAGLFDIFHMGELFLRGPAAAKDVAGLVTCRIYDMHPGRCRYGFMLNDKGGIIDDLIVFRISEEEFMIVVNAGTVGKDEAWMRKHISPGTELANESAETAKIDIQGPLSGKIMGDLAGQQAVEQVRKYHFLNVEISGMPVLLSRTGYTGELGYELFFPVEYAPDMWKLLLAQEGVKPVGLGARDTLRMEMGYSLYGNDIDEKHTPLEANLARFVFFEKDFLGKPALLKQQGKGVSRVLKGFICDSRRSARSHFKVTSGGKEIGEVTSGAFSPCLKRGMGLCYIDSGSAKEGTGVTLTDGKVEVAARVAAIPLYRHKTQDPRHRTGKKS